MIFIQVCDCKCKVDWPGFLHNKRQPEGTLHWESEETLAVQDSRLDEQIPVFQDSLLPIANSLALSCARMSTLLLLSRCENTILVCARIYSRDKNLTSTKLFVVKRAETSKHWALISLIT